MNTIDYYYRYNSCGTTLLRTLSKIVEVGFPQKLCYLSDEVLEAPTGDIISYIKIIISALNTSNFNCEYNRVRFCFALS